MTKHSTNEYLWAERDIFRARPRGNCAINSGRGCDIYDVVEQEIQEHRNLWHIYPGIVWDLVERATKGYLTDEEVIREVQKLSKEVEQDER